MNFFLRSKLKGVSVDPQPGKNLEACLDEDGPAVVDGRTLKWRGWHIFAFIVGLIIVAKVILAVVVVKNKVSPMKPVSEISGKFADRFASISNNTIDPCQDFNLFACTPNVKEIVDGQEQIISSTFHETTETVLRVVTQLLEEPNSNYEPRAVKMAKQMYSDCMANTSFSSYYNDYSWLPFTNGWQITLETTLAQIFARKDQSIFSIGNDIDEDTSIVLLTFDKGEPVPQIVGFTESWEVVAFEEDLKTLWEESKCEEDKGDIWSGRRNYRNFTLDHIQAQIPQIKWAKLIEHIFDILGLKKQVPSDMKVQFRCFNFFRGLGTLIENTGSRIVSEYIVARYRIENLFNLDNELFQNSNHSDSEDLHKNEDQLRHRRWKNCARIVNQGFGVAISHLYHQKDSKTKATKIVEEMTQYLKEAFRQVIYNQEWIAANGKDQIQKQLIDKLEHMSVSNVYPENIVNATMVDEYYEGLFLHQSSFMLNVLEIKKFLALKSFVGVDKTMADGDIETLIDPMEVNAYYIFQTNKIVIPVAALHYPMFDEDYPMYLNFANLGSSLAHEMVHGFDNSGIHYDKNGKFTSWGLQDAQKAFRNRATCFVEQFGKFEIPLINQFVDGNETLDENISDNASFHLSFLAYEMWAKVHNLKEPLISGLNFTIPQIFYIAFGQSWCQIPNEGSSQAYTHGVHSPGPLRTLGVVQNSANFGNAFGCPAGSAMNPTHKCSVWS